MKQVKGIKTVFQHMTSAQLLQQPLTVLEDINNSTVVLLATLDIETTFDLACAALFKSACSQITKQISGYSLSNTKLNGAEPLTTLELVNDDLAIKLKTSAAIETVQDLAQWPPFLCAKALLTTHLSDSNFHYDPEIPDELVPKFNEYPTEKHFYSVFTLDENKHGKLVELNGPIDLAYLEKAPQLSVRTGAIVRYCQSWTPVGLALGNLLHSLALAPGESTRIAMVDWSRRQGMKTSESLSQQERLTAQQMHSRSVNEVTQAVAREAQTGFSNIHAESSVQNTATSGYGLTNSEEALAAAGAGAAAGGATGTVIGAIGGAGVGGAASIASAGTLTAPALIAGGLVGAGAGGLVGLGAGGVAGFLGAAEFGATSDSGSQTVTDVVTTTSSSGERELAASMAQNIDDRTQQHASSSRSRRATIVQEVWQGESEEITTRAICNYNHMHALTIQYFEVVQMYSVRTELDRLQRALYVPMAPIRWTAINIERYRAILVKNAIDSRVLTALLLPPETVVLSFPTVAYAPSHIVSSYIQQGDSVLGFEGAKDVTGQHVAASVFESWQLPRGVILKDYQVGRYMRTGSAANLFTEFEAFGHKADATLLDLPLSNLRQLNWILPARDDDTATTPTQLDVILMFEYKDKRFYCVLPLLLTNDLYPSVSESITVAVAQFDATPDSDWLADHLTMFNKHYSRAVWRSVDETDVTHLLAPYQYEGQSIIDRIDRKPVAISGQYLVFAYHAHEEPQWESWLKAHGFKDKQKENETLMPMPTGGVFAEAIQGRANSAERLDLSRFWNWQDSPIPLNAPDIG